MKPFEYCIQTDQVLFRHAYGPSVAIGQEFHSYHELLLFLEGTAELIAENLRLQIRPNTLLLIPKETYHKVIIHGDPAHYRRCTLHFYDTEPLQPLIRQGMQAPAVIEMEPRLNYLFSLLTEPLENARAQMILNAVLPLLLHELSAKNRPLQRPNTENPVLSAVLEHINRHLGEKLTIEVLARKCSLSPSSLSHLFKKEMNISLHQYILKKKLITAARRIAAGAPATAAALECGFRDYSGFYKQYKKIFGHAPSQKILQVTDEG